MTDKNRSMKWALLLGLIALSILSLSPPSEKLKGGIDLVGGTSLLLEIDTTGLDLASQSGLSTRVMNILKQRVDPDGTLNLEWRPVGNTRLEIRMPRPPKETVERRYAKDAALDALADRNLRRFDVVQALDASPEQRESSLEGLKRGIEQRTELVEAIRQAYDEAKALESGDDAQAAKSATAKYDQALANLLATNVPIDRLTDILALGGGPKRDTELTTLRSEFPFLNALAGDSTGGSLLTRAVETYDAWSGQKAELEDPSDLKRRLKGAGVLEFRILADRDPSSPDSILDPKMQGSKSITTYTDHLAKRGPRPRPGDRFAWFRIEDPLKFTRAASVEELQQRIGDSIGPIISEYAGAFYVLAYDAPGYRMLRSSDKRKWKLRTAYVDRDPLSGENVVSFSLDPRGGKLFGELTGGNVQRSLCIVMDDKAVSHAVIQERITERCQIRGRFALERATDLVRTLEAGSLPARVKEEPLMEKTIGPSLGETNRRKGLQAAVLGAGLVALFVLFYYGFAAGGMVNIALALNLVFLLGAMALLQATFTLPGIAGVILTVGMAIDANVLIFERIREERNRGVLFKKALNAGYDKAFSTIMDANITTLIICIILRSVGSEEIKGFAITLGIGIVTSVFTSLFVTRLAFNTLISKNMLKGFSMRSIIGVPNVDWLSMRRKFWPISMAMVFLGAGAFITMSATDKESVFDIEFLGGTGVQLDLKSSDLTDEQLSELITADSSPHGTTAVGWLTMAADRLEAAEASAGDSARQYLLTSTDGSLTGEQLATMMRAALESHVERDGTVVRDRHSVSFEARTADFTLEQFSDAIADAANRTRAAADKMRSAKIQTVEDIANEGTEGHSYEVVTIETNRPLVQAAIFASIGDRLKVQQAIRFQTIADDELLNEPFFVVEGDDLYLRDVIGGESSFEIPRYRGGVAVYVSLDDTEQPLTVAKLEKRLREVTLRLGSEHHRTSETEVFPLGEGAPDSGYKRFAILTVDEAVLFDEVGEALWKDSLAEPFLAQVDAALSSEKSLSKVVQFAPQVAEQARNSAVFAVILALGSIVAYLSLRFGTKEYGLAAIVALIHDVSITLGLVTMSRFVAGTIVGDVLAIDAFRVDLPMIAALMTVIGYSLNDTIVVFDRIRENRGKIGKLAPATINNSINQTLSRTILTSLTTLLAVGVMYIFGGAGVHGFSFALIIGVVVGTYSSIGIATPLLYQPKLLMQVIVVIVALALIGMTVLFVSDQTWRLVWIALVAVGAIGMVLRVGGRVGRLGAGQPVAA